MMRTVFFVTCCLAALSVVVSAKVPEDSPVCVVGYLPHYRLDRVDADSLRGVTDLVYFGIEPSADGSLPNPIVSDEALAKLTKIAKANTCRLLLTVGGWGRSEGFAELARDVEARKRFVAGLTAFCQESGFNGVDYDWEHPKNGEELGHYSELIGDTKRAFAEHELMVTVAQASWQDLGKEVYENVERVHLMSYDHDFPQATLEKTTEDVEQLKTWGCPPDKITVGLPFYGRNEKREARTYADLIRSVAAGDDGRDEVDGYAFNGRQTIRSKVAIAMRDGLAGVMIWEVGQDTKHDARSLLTAVRDGIEVFRKTQAEIARVEEKWDAACARDPWLSEWVGAGREPQEILMSLMGVWGTKQLYNGELPEADWPTALKELGAVRIEFKGPMGIVRMSLEDGVERGYVFATPLASVQPRLGNTSVWEEVWGMMWRFERSIESDVEG